jgi:hypothetical protein
MSTDNTFHNFATCIYTAQGQIVCQNGHSTKKPLMLEGFVDTRPNENEAPCHMLNKKFNETASKYQCNASSEIADPKNCTFRFTNCQY